MNHRIQKDSAKEKKINKEEYHNFFVEAAEFSLKQKE